MKSVKSVFMSGLYLGFLIYYSACMFIQDFLGLEVYIEHFRKMWVDIHWSISAIVFIASVVAVVVVWRMLCRVVRSTDKEVRFKAGFATDSILLYKPPFKFQHGYIYDDNGNMVADRAAEGAIARVRGWGRIGAMKNAESLQDDVGKHIAQALTEYWENQRS